ncbi:hypothetical protein L211DRAFT_850881 [Terfezia boudieri ATCC MYA-4762]|uniref:Uncharacterized protein n=1 Tax=Terfezia boudieri ATCC MYA-4762 TaxID=1051890 RepID=A0A3N4LGU0_9PEZI|nr:hypothetical protein L211DRAFT_850881 [Terfezia boudieri ATCC MYA-4762]
MSFYHLGSPEPSYAVATTNNSASEYDDAACTTAECCAYPRREAILHYEAQVQGLIKNVQAVSVLEQLESVLVDGKEEKIREVQMLKARSLSDKRCYLVIEENCWGRCIFDLKKQTDDDAVSIRGSIRGGKAPLPPTPSILEEKELRKAVNELAVYLGNSRLLLSKYIERLQAQVSLASTTWRSTIKAPFGDSYFATRNASENRLLQ